MAKAARVVLPGVRDLLAAPARSVMGPPPVCNRL